MYDYPPFSYYEPPDEVNNEVAVFTRTKRVTTTKPHPCDVCGDLILAGSRATYYVTLTALRGFEHGWQHPYHCEYE